MGNTSSDCVHYMQNQQLMVLAKGDGDCHQMQELLFHFGGNYSGDSSLQTGALLGGSAGKVEIHGDYNQFESGNSSSTATSGATKLQELLFHFGGNYSGDSSLQTGALLGGSAGKVEIYGNNNQFESGNSKSTATSGATTQHLMLI